MQSRLSTAVTHGLAVAGHILIAMLFVGAISYLTSNQSMFSAYLVSLGLPVALVNIVFAAVLKYLQTHEPIAPVIDTAPNV